MGVTRSLSHVWRCHCHTCDSDNVTCVTLSLSQVWHGHCHTSHVVWHCHCHMCDTVTVTRVTVTMSWVWHGHCHRCDVGSVFTEGGHVRTSVCTDGQWQPASVAACLGNQLAHLILAKHPYVLLIACSPPQNGPFAWGSEPLSNASFLGLTWVHRSNGISIGSVVFAGLTTVTERSTDRQIALLPDTISGHFYVCTTAMQRKMGHRTSSMGGGQTRTSDGSPSNKANHFCIFMTVHLQLWDIVLTDTKNKRKTVK